MTDTDLAPPPTFTHTIRVLVVDDVPDIRKLIRLTLRRAGSFDVVGEAGDGAEAIAEAARLQPDIVLLDLSMPVMDGLEALPAIIAASPDSKVLVLSGFTAREMSDEAIKRGASGYMEKGGIVGKLGPRLREFVPTFPPPQRPPGHERDMLPMLIRDLSHPLSVLHALAARLLRANDLPPDAVRSALVAVARAAQRIESILRSYSDAGTLRTGTLDLTLAPTNLSELVRDCLDELAEIQVAHPVSVDVDDNVVIRIDADRIRDVVLQLLSNAAKFSPHRAPITISSLVGESTVEVRVHDSGRGIPEVLRERIFERFVQFDPERGGNGLGLYLSREIARAHGGDVFLASCDEMSCVFALRLQLVT